MKNTLRTTILITLFYVHFAAIANAANWYIDPNAQGTETGTSWANAWTVFSSIVWGSSGVKAGDTLYISGGTTSQTYTTTLTVGASGVAGNPITIRPGQDVGHNGEVILDFDALGDSAVGFGINLANRKYVVVDGSVASARKLTIKNLRNTTNRSTASAIEAGSSSYITIQYINILNCNNGFHATYGTGYDVNNCNLSGIRGNGAISFVASTGGWDANITHHNYIGLVWKRGMGGPDGVQIGNGVSIYNNTIRVDEVTYATSDQHPDSVQAVGSYHKIYNNDFVNIGDSGYNGSGNYFESNPHDIWLFNNTFRIIVDVDPYPEFVRFYACGDTLTNFKVLNNAFIDNPYTTFYIRCTNASTASGVEIRNNIWYNSGTGKYSPALDITGPGFTDASFALSNNIYYGGAYIIYLGTTYTATDWLVAHDPNSSTAQPTFLSYLPRNINNNLHLSPNDTAATALGTNLSSYFTTDKDGKPSATPWDIGPYKRPSSIPQPSLFRIITAP